ncbi:hypothetical protein FA95DRAFT_1506627, partial [Auriscalpium vulgare]
HLAGTFVPADVAELVELRARERTFDGAYARTALTNIGDALALLNLFDPRFYRNTPRSLCCSSLLRFFRGRHSRHALADPGRDEDDVNIVKMMQEGKVLRRPFVTAGWIVVAVAGLSPSRCSFCECTRAQN